MPRNPFIYNLPPGTTPQQPNTTIESAMFNTAMEDIEQTFNTATPVVYGGTGSTNVGDAATALKLISYGSVQALSQSEKGTATVNSGQMWEQIGGIYAGSNLTGVQVTGLEVYSRLRISFNAFVLSNGTGLSLRLGTAGGGVSSANYFNVYNVIYNLANNAGERLGTNSHQMTALAGASSVGAVQGFIDIIGFNQTRCHIVSTLYYNNSSDGRFMFSTVAGSHDLSARNQLIIFPGTGNITVSDLKVEGSRI